MTNEARRLTPGEQLVALQTQSNKILERGVKALEHIGALLERMVPPEPPEVATDAELDSTKGDPTVNFPKPFLGAIYKGHKYSQCPPAYLDHLAKSFDGYAKKNRKEGDDQKAGFDERSARLARGWAARIRARAKPSPRMTEPTTLGDPEPKGDHMGLVTIIPVCVDPHCIVCTESVHIKEATSQVCEVHDWPVDGLAKRLINAMRQRFGKGGINVCHECLTRAKESVT